MRTVFVSGASGIIGYGILRSLRKSSVPLRLVASTIHENSIAPAFCDVFELAPPTNSDNYLDWLKDVRDRHSVDFMIPGIECDLFKWNDHREELFPDGGVLLNDPGLIDLCRDKWLFYQALMELAPEFAIPTSIEGGFDELADEFSLPFLLKPRRGSASRGIVKVETREDFDPYSDQMGDTLLAQSLVGSVEEEHTASGFFTSDSHMCCQVNLKRTLSSEGFTQCAEVADVGGMAEGMSTLGKVLSAVGPTNFQFRIHEGQLKLLEINPRISSATSIRTAFGYNECLMSLDYFLDGFEPSQPAVTQGRAVRYTEDYIFP